MRIALAVLTVLVMGCAVSGIGMGQATAERQPSPGPAEVAASEQRIAAGGATTARGRERFKAEGCDACHAIAAIGADGKLGPRLDALDEDADDIVESIVEPREDTADGYPANLMPTGYAQRMSDTDLRALAAFVAAASGSGEDSGRGRGRGGDDGSGSGRGRGRGED